ncbi:hypothetical protein C7378_0762 [Acidipila rosea]|uniref:Uncharacterized protein n=1 Tax=Acidipila rosea TaxID=768535 RepID=A0A4R1LDZ6_9BACT|nr:hypothetical protein C7378_0762 [Acidipila rosea]
MRWIFLPAGLQAVEIAGTRACPGGELTFADLAAVLRRRRPPMDQLIAVWANQHGCFYVGRP